MRGCIHPPVGGRLCRAFGARQCDRTRAFTRPDGLLIRWLWVRVPPPEPPEQGKRTTHRTSAGDRCQSHCQRDADRSLTPSAPRSLRSTVANRAAASAAPDRASAALPCRPNWLACLAFPADIGPSARASLPSWQRSWQRPGRTGGATRHTRTSEAVSAAPSRQIVNPLGGEGGEGGGRRRGAVRASWGGDPGGLGRGWGEGRVCAARCTR